VLSTTSRKLNKMKKYQYALEWFLVTWKKIKLIFFMMAPFYFVPLGVKTICVKLF
jgi:hypothetical protein